MPGWSESRSELEHVIPVQDWGEGRDSQALVSVHCGVNRLFALELEEKTGIWTLLSDRHDKRETLQF